MLSGLALVSIAPAEAMTDGVDADVGETNNVMPVRPDRLTSSAPPQTLTYGVDAGVGETDNVTLVHTDKISQTMAVADADFDYQEQSSRLNVDAKGNFTYLDYLQNAYHDELLGRFDGSANLALIPQRLTWVLQDDFGKMAVDPFTPTVPTNLENVNYVSTGPDVTLHVGGLSFVNMSARVSRVDYEISPYTNNRAQGSLAWGWQLSALSSVSLNGDTERVLFENTVLNTDFDRSNVFARYTLQGARTELSVDLGGTTVQENGTSNHGGLATISLSRVLSASSKLTVAFGRELTDGSTSFSGLQGGAQGVVGTAPAATTSENYTTNYGSVGWTYLRNRTSIAFSGRWEKDLYAGFPLLDHTMTTAEFRMERSMTRSLTAQLLGRLFKSDYDRVSLGSIAGSPNNDTESVAAALIWRHGRGLEVKLQCEHTTYTTSPNDTGYRENRVYLKVGYRPIRDRSVVDDVPQI
jgi:hypothetical protein